MRCCERGLDLFPKVGAGRQVLLVAEDGCQPPGNDPVGGELARQRMRHAELFQLAVQPVGKLLVLMAIAQEGVIAGPKARNALRRRLGRAVHGRQSGKLDHMPPPPASSG